MTILQYTSTILSNRLPLIVADNTSVEWIVDIIAPNSHSQAALYRKEQAEIAFSTSSPRLLCLREEPQLIAKDRDRMMGAIQILRQEASLPIPIKIDTYACAIYLHEEFRSRNIPSHFLGGFAWINVGMASWRRRLVFIGNPEEDPPGGPGWRRHGPKCNGPGNWLVYFLAGQKSLPMENTDLPRHCQSHRLHVIIRFGSFETRLPGAQANMVVHSDTGVLESYRVTSRIKQFLTFLPNWYGATTELNDHYSKRHELHKTRGRKARMSPFVRPRGP